MKNEKQTFDEKMKNLTGLEVVKKEDKPKRKTLAIVGTASSRFKAPYNDPNVEIWGVAHCLLLNDIPRMDKVYEIHLPYIYEQEISPFSNKPIIYHANKEYAPAWRDKTDVEVICSVPDSNLNKCVVFPREELKNKYRELLPVADAFYATNSIAWMVLWAIDLGFEEIHLYGIHLETDSEWQYERPCNEWWLGVFAGIMYAKGQKGVVYLPEESDVLRGYHEYGFADIEVRRKKIKSKVEFYEKAISELQNQRNMIISEINRLNNELAIEPAVKMEQLKQQQAMIENEIKSYDSLDDKAVYKQTIEQKIKERLALLNRDISEVNSRISAFNGARDATQYFLKELNA